MWLGRRNDKGVILRGWEGRGCRLFVTARVGFIYVRIEVILKARNDFRMFPAVGNLIYKLCQISVPFWLKSVLCVIWHSQKEDDKLVVDWIEFSQWCYE